MALPIALPHHDLMIQPVLTVYHDGSCPLCRLEIGHYRAQQGAERIDFIDVSDPDTHPGQGLTREEAMGRLHVRLPSGELKSGGAAFIEIWKVLPRWRRPAQVAQLPGLTGALDVGNTLFAPFRPALARVVGRFSKSETHS